MIRSIALFPLVFLVAPITAQTPYFQQEVNYTIQATLNDRDHTLDAHIRMEYTNNAPDALSEIWMHLWANAFKNRSSAFCKQKLRDGNSRFYFAPDSSMGYFENLDFTVDGKKVAWRIDPDNPDIAVLQLAQPLPPGGKLVIETPFLLKIPASFSRLGHVRTSYQMTQWYPKPAVYDTRGWHAMPYLDVGEFYSEFGAFDVSITLPDNYVVGATGVLQTASEVEFLQQKEAETRAEIARRETLLSKAEKAEARKAPFPPSSKTTKTLRYTAEQVHDFAWFADKRFYVLKDTARLASGATVDCWAMFTNEEFDIWEKGAFYVRRSVEFYSNLVGPYPWPHATAVHSALSAGGGMEYPMITVIGNSGGGKDLDEVITHEVGHNWFYGILASNERDHPFMDEGINSYYENRYMVENYGSGTTDNMLPRWALDTRQSGSVTENAYLMLAREGADTPPDSHSNDFWFIAYGIQVYMKTAMCLEWLERSLGKARFDQAMQAYYDAWKFKHPYPEDLRAAWQVAGLDDTDWFFKTMQTQQHFDMALSKIKRGGQGYQLTVKNRGALNAPYSITALRAGQPVQTIWYPAAPEKTTEVEFPDLMADLFVLDYEHAALDFIRKNNSRRTAGLFPGVEPLHLRLLALAERPARTELGILPWFGWNNYDKAMAGLILYNAPFPARRFQYFLLPGYGLKSKNLVGLADLKYRFLPGGFFQKIELGFNAKTCTYDFNPVFDYNLRFYRLMPQVRATFRSPSPAFEHELTIRTLFIGKEEPMFNTPETYERKEWERATIYEVRYSGQQRALPNPNQFAVALEYQDYTAPNDQPASYLRSSLEWKQQFFYKRNRKVEARAFAGFFLKNSQRNRGNVATNNLSGDIARGSFALNPQGYNDYRFDQIFLGRSEDNGFLSRQVSQTEGGFKNAFGTPTPYDGVLGNSNSYILSLNLKADLPFRLPLGLPLKPYFDIGYFDDATPLGADRSFSDQLLWSGGLMLEFFKGGLEVYFPLVNAKRIQDAYTEQTGNNYFKRISWSIRLGKITPITVAQRLANN
ncbi:MAG: M1 family metallopeptidase [Lewinellaceae bacterium]|nr:M1 family metallopeptidase [Lewinellaceae bacterium]